MPTTYRLSSTPPSLAPGYDNPYPRNRRGYGTTYPPTDYIQPPQNKIGAPIHGTNLLASGHGLTVDTGIPGPLLPQVIRDYERPVRNASQLPLPMHDSVSSIQDLLQINNTTHGQRSSSSAEAHLHHWNVDQPRRAHHRVLAPEVAASHHCMNNPDSVCPRRSNLCIDWLCQFVVKFPAALSKEELVECIRVALDLPEGPSGVESGLDQLAAAADGLAPVLRAPIPRGPEAASSDEAPLSSSTTGKEFICLLCLILGIDRAYTCKFSLKRHVLAQHKSFKILVQGNSKPRWEFNILEERNRDEIGDLSPLIEFCIGIQVKSQRCGVKIEGGRALALLYPDVAASMKSRKLL